MENAVFLSSFKNNVMVTNLNFLEAVGYYIEQLGFAFFSQEIKSSVVKEKIVFIK